MKEQNRLERPGLILEGLERQGLRRNNRADSGAIWCPSEHTHRLPFSQPLRAQVVRFGGYKRPQPVTLQVCEHRAAGSQPLLVLVPIFSAWALVVIYFLVPKGTQVTLA